MKIICVNTGSKYRQHPYTMNLYRSLARNTVRDDWGFECITESEFPGWWGKIPLFAPDERVIYIDLDMVITGNMDFIFRYQGPFCIRRNPWPGKAWCDSSIMSIAPGFGAHIKERFLKSPDKIMAEWRSDQELIAAMVKEADTWQDFAPGKTKSFKADKLWDGPDGASIVSFHGLPKPHEVVDSIPWVKEHWQ